MISAQADADARWQLYEQVAGVHRTVTRHGNNDAVGGSAVAAEAAATPTEEQQS
jgi:hypothetical protein